MGHVSTIEDADLEADFACSACGTDLVEVYYEVNQAPFCEPCSAVVYDRYLRRDSWRRFARAALFGLIAGIAGSILYYFVVRVTGIALGWIAVAVGLIVGKAVRTGSRGRGGPAYQFLAVFLTYSALVSTSIPRLVTMVHQNQAKARNLPNRPRPLNLRGRFAARPRPPRPRWLRDFIRGTAIVLIAYLLPLLLVWDNPLMLLVIGFGLWEAWKINRPTPLSMEGPFHAEEPGDGPHPEAIAGMA